MSVKVFGSGDAINEQTTAQYACTLVDPTGAAIDSGAVTAIAATLKDEGDDTVINGRSAQSVLGVNGGTLSAGGAFALTLSTLDTIARGTAAAAAPAGRRGCATSGAVRRTGGSPCAGRRRLASSALGPGESGRA